MSKITFQNRLAFGCVLGLFAYCRKLVNAEVVYLQMVVHGAEAKPAFGKRFLVMEIENDFAVA